MARDDSLKSVIDIPLFPCYTKNSEMISGASGVARTAPGRMAIGKVSEL